MSVIHASWVEGFAARLLQLRPGKHPLDAVRQATHAFEHSSMLPPDVAVEDFVAGSGAHTPGISEPPSSALDD